MARNGVLAIALRVGISAVLMAALFLLLPGLRSLIGGKEQNQKAVLIERKDLTEVEKKEVKQKHLPVRMMRPVEPQSHSSTSRSTEGSFKFSPDLGVQGNGGVAVEEQRNVKSQVFNEDETDVRPELVARTPVEYPLEARSKGIEGTVEVELVVDPTGRVTQVDFVQLPSELFRRPVMTAVMQYRFKPAQVKGVAVNVRVRQKIKFGLSQE